MITGNENISAGVPRVKSAALPLLLFLLMIPAIGCGGGAEPAAHSAQNAVAASDQHWRMETYMARVAVWGTSRDYMAGLKEGEEMGIIEIPRIGIRERIIQGTASGSLVRGAGHIEETPLPGMGSNFAIAGDRVLYTAPFLRLEAVEPGDAIWIELPYGRFQYTVESNSITGNTDISVLYPKGYDSLTLSTCDPRWQVSTRVTVSARMTAAEAGSPGR